MCGGLEESDTAAVPGWPPETLSRQSMPVRRGVCPCHQNCSKESDVQPHSYTVSSPPVPTGGEHGTGSGDIIHFVRNPLDTASKSTEILALRARGVTVSVDEVSAITEPQIHNDNVLVPQVTADLATLWTQLCAPTGVAFQGRIQGVVDRRCAVNCPSIPIRLKVNNTRILTRRGRPTAGESP